MAALGFNVNAHRVAAYAFASLSPHSAACCRSELPAISPGSVSVGASIDILIIAVVAASPAPLALHRRLHLRHPAYLRSICASSSARRQSLPPSDRLGFCHRVLVVDGVIGLCERWRRRTVTTDKRAGEATLMDNAARRFSAVGSGAALSAA
jgi:branched-chain amino acid transport system permease protein